MPHKPDSAKKFPVFGRLELATIALLLLAAWAAYGNTLSAPFLFDDRSGVMENPSITDLRSVGEVLSPPRTATGAVGRPLVNLSLAVNFAMSGLNPAGYRATNIILHGVTGGLLFLLLLRLLQRSTLAVRFGQHALPLAAGAALLWTVHPLQTESVTCIIQRSEILGSLSYLLTLWCFVRSIGSARAVWWWAAAIGVSLAGALCKEFIATVPLVALVLDRLYFAGSYREAWRQRRGIYLGFFVLWVAVALLIVTHEKRGGSVGFGLGVTSWDYLITQSEAIMHYLQMAVWPDHLVLDYGSYLAPGFAAVWSQFLGVAALVVGTVVLLARGSPWAMSGVWLFCILAPSSSFVPLVTQTIAEHRMYLPLAGVVVPTVLEGYLLVRSRTILVALVLGLAVTLAAVSVRRNAQYSSPVTIWSDTVAKVPENARAHLNLGQALMAEGLGDEAVRHYHEAIRLRPGYAMAHYNLGNALATRGDLSGAKHQYEESLHAYPAQASAHFNLAQVCQRLGLKAEARENLEAAVRVDPNHGGARFHLARLLVTERNLSEAEAHLRRCVEIDPKSARYRTVLAEVLLATWQTEAAVEHLHRAAALGPTDPATRFAIGRGLLAANLPQEALAHLRNVEAIQPDHPGLREALASAQRQLTGVLQTLPPENKDPAE